MKNFISFIIMASAMMFSSAFTTVSAADTYLPMAAKGQIDSPAILADRIDESLKKDPTGNGQVRGANISPNGFVNAVRGAGGTVGDVKSLPTYLRQLVGGPMPAGQTRMSRVKHSPNGNSVDLSTGFARSGRPGEKGWYDPNSNYLIMAGDCSNSPLKTTPRVAPPVVASSKPAPRAVTPPAFGNRSLGCPTNDRLLLVSIYEETALQANTCAANSVLPQGGRMPRPQGVTSEFSGDGLEPDRLSRFCGMSLYQDYKSGKFGVGQDDHGVTVVVREGGEEYVVSQGTVTGRTYTPNSEYANTVVGGSHIRIPDVYTAGNVVVIFDDYKKLASPTPSGIIERVSSFNRGCKVMTFSAIEGDGGSPEVAVTGD